MMFSQDARVRPRLHDRLPAAAGMFKACSRLTKISRQPDAGTSLYFTTLCCMTKTQAFLKLALLWASELIFSGFLAIRFSLEGWKSGPRLSYSCWQRDRCPSFSPSCSGPKAKCLGLEHRRKRGKSAKRAQVQL